MRYAGWVGLSSRVKHKDADTDTDANWSTASDGPYVHKDVLEPVDSKRRQSHSHGIAGEENKKKKDEETGSMRISKHQGSPSLSDIEREIAGGYQSAKRPPAVLQRNPHCRAGRHNVEQQRHAESLL